MNDLLTKNPRQHSVDPTPAYVNLLPHHEMGLAVLRLQMAREQVIISRQRLIMVHDAYERAQEAASDAPTQRIADDLCQTLQNAIGRLESALEAVNAVTGAKSELTPAFNKGNPTEADNYSVVDWPF